jgi:hypothetical protein
MYSLEHAKGTPLQDWYVENTPDENLLWKDSTWFRGKQMTPEAGAFTDDDVDPNIR